MIKPLEMQLEIDNTNLNKLGKNMKNFVRWQWFMRNGFFSSSWWKWSRLLCLINAHDWEYRYDIDYKDKLSILDMNTLKLNIWCGRCHYKHKFDLYNNDLFHILASLVEVKTSTSIEHYKKWPPSSHENDKTISNLIKILKKQTTKLENAIK